MKTRSLCLSIALLAAAGCGRPLFVGGDGGVDGPVALDASAASDSLSDDCTQPPGSCFGDEDCPPAWVCAGCGPDPCCPTCDHCLGTCVRPGGPQLCATTDDCGDDRYCHRPPGCGAAPGECRPRPTHEECPLTGALCEPLCGCDGATYCRPCEAHQAGTTVAYVGACHDCDAIDQAYRAAVIAAKRCSPFDDGPPQCTQRVWGGLGGYCPCPCETYVNPQNTAALAQMADYEQRWLAQGCGPSWPPQEPISCCALFPACVDPAAGKCHGDSDPGTCIDVGR